MLYVSFTLSITFHVICILITWAFIFLLFLFCSLEPFFSFSIHLIINMNPKKYFNDTWTICLLSLALWSIGLLGLRIRNLGLCWRPWTLIDILSGVLEVYLNTLGFLFVLCAGWRSEKHKKGGWIVKLKINAMNKIFLSWFVWFQTTPVHPSRWFRLSPTRS